MRVVAPAKSLNSQIAIFRDVLGDFRGLPKLAFLGPF